MQCTLQPNAQVMVENRQNYKPVEPALRPV